MLPGILAASCVSAEPLTLAYAHRPGYAEMIDGVPKGVSIELAHKIIDAAKLDVFWELMVQPRQMAMLKKSAPDYCAIGLFKTPEREAYARYSNAYYQDRRFVIVASRLTADKLRSKAAFAELLQDTRLKLGLLDSLSYGVKVDEMLKTSGTVRRIEGKIEQVFQMVASGRIDYTIASPEEVEPIMNAANVTHAAVEILSYPDFPEGNMRYFLCSRAVEQSVMDKLNAGIKMQKIHLD
jgi:polar amino acid transport system substrate-binding protein